MSRAITFDTLQYAKKLQAAGFTEQQAEIQAEALAEIIDDKIATKQDLKELRIATQRDLKELEYRMVIKLGAMIIIAVGVILGAMKYLI